MMDFPRVVIAMPPPREAIEVGRCHLCRQIGIANIKHECGEEVGFACANVAHAIALGIVHGATGPEMLKALVAVRDAIDWRLFGILDGKVLGNDR